MGTTYASVIPSTQMPVSFTAKPMTPATSVPASAAVSIG